MPEHERPERPPRIPRPRTKTTREFLEQIVGKLERIERKQGFLMAQSEQQAAAFAGLVAKIDEVFGQISAPLVAELRAQIAALESEDIAEDERDQGEISRLTELVNTAEADTLAAIQTVTDHVSALGTPPAEPV